MYNDEIFIIGKPPILLHSKDAGKSWERVPLSPKVVNGRCPLLLVISYWFWASLGVSRCNSAYFAIFWSRMYVGSSSLRNSVRKLATF